MHTQVCYDISNGTNVTKPLNLLSVNEAKNQAKCLEMKGQVLVIRMRPDRQVKILRKPI